MMGGNAVRECREMLLVPVLFVFKGGWTNEKSFVVSFRHLMRGDAFGLLDRTASSALDRSVPDSPVSTEELSQRLPDAINITNFPAFDV